MKRFDMKFLLLENKKINKSFFLFYVMLLITYLFMSILSKHGDCTFVTNWSINIWDALFSGRIREYFLVAAQTARDAGEGGCCYGILNPLPLSLWNFPLWLSRIITKSNSVGTILCHTWSKIFFVICAHIMSVYCAKIVQFFTEDKELDVTVFLYTLGCGTMFLSIAFFGQDEIIYMTVLVMAVYYIIINKKTLGYILLGISCTVCNIMLVPSLAILLIKEKNLLKVGTILVCFVLPEKIVSAFCGIGQLPEILKTYTVCPPLLVTTLTDWFFHRTLFQASDFRISFLAVALILIYTFCYLQKSESQEQEKYKIILHPALALLAINLFSWLHCYRWFTYFPLLSICVFLQGHKKGNLKCGLVFLTLFEYARVGMMVTLNYCLRFDAFRFGFIKRLLQLNEYNGDFYYFFHSILDQSKFDIYYIFVCSLGIACAILLLVFLFKKNLNFELSISQKTLTVIHATLPLLLSVCVLVLPIVCPLFAQSNYYVSDISYNNNSGGFDMKERETVSAAFSLKNTSQINEIQFRAYTWENNYGDAKLLISIYDENDLQMYSDGIPLENVKNNDITSVALKDVKLKKGKYTIRFMCDKALDFDFALAANPAKGRKILYHGERIEDMSLCLHIIGKRMREFQKSDEF